MTNESTYTRTFEFFRGTFHFIFHISYQVLHACGSRCNTIYTHPQDRELGIQQRSRLVWFGLGLDLECIIDTWFHRKSITVNIMDSGNTFIILTPSDWTFFPPAAWCVLFRIRPPLCGSYFLVLCARDYICESFAATHYRENVK